MLLGLLRPVSEMVRTYMYTGPIIYVVVTTKTSPFVSELKRLECGPMPNVMTALPNIGGAVCPTPQTLADAHY